MSAVMSSYFYEPNGELIARPVQALQHGFKVFPMMSSCCTSFSLGSLVDSPLRPSVSYSGTGGGHNILVLYLFAS